jgi:hypothetical protein
LKSVLRSVLRIVRRRVVIAGIVTVVGVVTVITARVPPIPPRTPPPPEAKRREVEPNEEIIPEKELAFLASLALLTPFAFPAFPATIECLISSVNASVR